MLSSESHLAIPSAQTTIASVTASALTSYRKVLYVGNLAQQVSRDALYNLFIPFGEVLDVTIPLVGLETITSDGPAPSSLGKHKGYAFVEFELPEDATEALENLNNCEFYGRIITVNYSKATNLSKEAFSDLNVPLWTLQSGETATMETTTAQSSTEQHEPENKKSKLS